MEAGYWEKQGELVICRLCHHQCKLRDGGWGVCRTRQARDGKLHIPYAGRITALAMDPIEKKPFYHYMPGSRSFSVGYMGCNLHCPFCQNWHISMNMEAESSFLSPGELLARAGASGAESISHTYSEPLIHAEYVRECLEIGRRMGLPGLVVSNGMIQGEAALDILEYCDAANIDIKTFDADRYKKMLGGDLETVKTFVRLAHSSGVHLELTTLLVPGLSDDEWQMEAIAEFIAGISEDIPWHLSYYRPMYKYNEPALSPARIRKLYNAARVKLKHVYCNALS